MFGKTKDNCPFYGKKHSDETKRKISEKRKGIKLDESKIKNMKLISKGKNNPMYGKKHSDETKKKISDSKKGKNSLGKHPLAKKVYCIDLKKEWSCGKAASDELNICHTSIMLCCKGRLKTAGKLRWRYA